VAKTQSQRVADHRRKVKAERDALREEVADLRRQLADRTDTPSDELLREREKVQQLKALLNNPEALRRQLAKLAAPATSPAPAPLIVEATPAEVEKAADLRSELAARKAKTEARKSRDNPVACDALGSRTLDIINLPFPKIVGYGKGYADQVRSTFSGVRKIRQMIRDGASLESIEAEVKSVARYYAEWIGRSEGADPVAEYVNAWASLSA
jgi:hypothetical protein